MPPLISLYIFFKQNWEYVEYQISDSKIFPTQYYVMSILLHRKELVICQSQGWSVESSNSRQPGWGKVGVVFERKRKIPMPAPFALKVESLVPTWTGHRVLTPG